MPTISPLMDMPIPDVGPTGDPGPAWAQYLNDCLDIIDSHSHIPGQGAQVPTAGLNINADLNFNANNIINVRSYRCAVNPSSLVGTNDKGCVYNVNGDLYWNNGSGTAVRITNGSGINIAGVAGFYGDYAQPGVPAAATYSDITKTFAFTQDTGKAAIISAGTYQLYEPGVAGANPINLKSPTSLGSSYDIIFPTAASSSNSLMRFDNTGQGKFVNLLGTTGQVTVTQNSNDITLSTPTIISNSAWSPSTASLVNITSIVFSTSGCWYSRVNDIVNFHLTFSCTLTATFPSGVGSCFIGLPINKLSGAYTTGDYILTTFGSTGPLSFNADVAVGAATSFSIRLSTTDSTPKSLTNLQIYGSYSIA